MEDAYDKELLEVQKLGGQNAEYVFILAECEKIESLCDSLFQQINALDVNAGFGGLKIHVLEQAMAATQGVPKPLSAAILQNLRATGKPTSPRAIPFTL